MHLELISKERELCLIAAEARSDFLYLKLYSDCFRCSHSYNTSKILALDIRKKNVMVITIVRLRTGLL